MIRQEIASKNKCFYLEVSTTYEKRNGKTETYKLMRLYDINENKEYAAYDGMLCTLTIRRADWSKSSFNSSRNIWKID
jgi:hypothetical protein